MEKNYVTIAVTNEVELARDYVEMLRNCEIPASFIVNEQIVQGAGVAILVKEEFAAQAKSLIEARNSGGDFYEYIYGDDYADKIDEMEE